MISWILRSYEVDTLNDLASKTHQSKAKFAYSFLQVFDVWTHPCSQFNDAFQKVVISQEENRFQSL